MWLFQLLDQSYVTYYIWLLSISFWLADERQHFNLATSMSPPLAEGLPRHCCQPVHAVTVSPWVQRAKRTPASLLPARSPRPGLFIAGCQPRQSQGLCPEWTRNHVGFYNNSWNLSCLKMLFFCPTGFRELSLLPRMVVVLVVTMTHPCW